MFINVFIYWEGGVVCFVLMFFVNSLMVYNNNYWRYEDNGEIFKSVNNIFFINILIGDLIYVLYEVLLSY